MIYDTTATTKKNTKWDKKTVEVEFIQLVKQLGRIPQSKELIDLHSALYHATFKYGTYEAYKKKAQKHVNYDLLEEEAAAKKIRKIMKDGNLSHMPQMKEIEAIDKDLSEIVKKYAVYRGNFRAFAKAHNIKYGRAVIDEKEVLRLFHGGLTALQIAKTMKCTRDNVYQILRDHSNKEKEKKLQEKRKSVGLKKGDLIELTMNTSWYGKRQALKGVILYANKRYFTLEMKGINGKFKESINFRDVKAGEVKILRLNGKAVTHGN